MAANDLTNLADVKAWLSIATGDTTYDAMLGRLITSCSGFMQAWMNNPIIQASYTEFYNGNGKTAQFLRNGPVTAVAAVTINGVTVPLAPALTPGASQGTGFSFDDLQVYLTGWEFCRGYRNVQVTYTAGYATVPFELAQGCIEVVADKFQKRTRIGQVSKTLNGEVVAFSLKDVPAEVLTIMQQYRRVAPV